MLNNQFCFDIINPITGDIFSRSYSDYQVFLENYIICMGANKMIGIKREYNAYMVHVTGAIYPLKPTKAHILAYFPYSSDKCIRMAINALYGISIPSVEEKRNGTSK